MRSILYELVKYIIRYYEIHPVRFFSFISIVLIAFVILVYLVISLNIFPRGLCYIKVRLKSFIDIDRTAKSGKIVCNIRNVIFSKNAFLLYSVTIASCIVFIFLLKRNIIDKNSEHFPIRSSIYTFGIDISHYQGNIKWDQVKKSHHPVQFVFIRSTMGVDGEDMFFKRNWRNAKNFGYFRGAYHYYRPNENSTKQFENFSNNVRLQPGDFPPVLDIENSSKYGMLNLRKGIKNWLK